VQPTALQLIKAEARLRANQQRSRGPPVDRIGKGFRHDQLMDFKIRSTLTRRTPTHPQSYASEHSRFWLCAAAWEVDGDVK
jgi:hypothetical protein